jgi:hypothetical protein
MTDHINKPSGAAVKLYSSQASVIKRGSYTGNLLG